jgi:hypothetical protein
MERRKGALPPGEHCDASREFHVRNREQVEVVRHSQKTDRRKDVITNFRATTAT